MWIKVVKRVYTKSGMTEHTNLELAGNDKGDD